MNNPLETEAPKLTLTSGSFCQLVRMRNDMIPNDDLLVFLVSQGQPSSVEMTEMLHLGTSHAQSLAHEVFRDPEAFTIL